MRLTRREFAKRLALAAAGFTILPGAGRLWKAIVKEPTLIANPEWVNAPYEHVAMLPAEIWHKLEKAYVLLPCPQRFIAHKDGGLVEVFPFKYQES